MYRTYRALPAAILKIQAEVVWQWVFKVGELTVEGCLYEPPKCG